MSTFKIKPEKVRQFHDIKTLDEVHRKTANKFKKKKSCLPQKKAKLEEFQSELQQLESMDKSTYTNENITKRAKLKDSIEKLQDEIQDIVCGESEIDYYSKTEEMLVDYYDIVEQDNSHLYDINPDLKQKKEPKQKEELTLLDKLNMLKKKKGKAKKVCRKKRYTATSIRDKDRKNCIASYFNIETKDEEKVGDKDKRNRAELYDQYIMVTDSSKYFNKGVTLDDENNKCDDCGSDKTVIRSEGISVCEKCGTFDSIIVEAESGGYNDGGGGMYSGGDKTYPYKRRNHMSE